MKPRKIAKNFATVTSLPQIRSRLGRVLPGSTRAQEIFGWPCAVVLTLEDGQRAYVLDYDKATRAPLQLRVALDHNVMETWLLGGSIPVIVQSIFGELIVVGVQWRGGSGPVGAFGCSEAA